MGLYSLIFPVILGCSWLAFFLAQRDISLVYMPLRSYFIPMQLPASSRFLDSPIWFLAHNKIKAAFSLKFFNEIFIWIIILALIYVFIESLGLWSWLGLNKIKSKTDLYSYNFKQIGFLGLSIAAVAVFLLPNDSSDLFGYVARGQQQVAYDMNPFSTVIASIDNWRTDPLLTNFLWQKNPSPYGPFFMLIAKFLTSISFNNLWLALLLFKLFNLGIFASVLFLLYVILQDKKFIKIFAGKFGKSDLVKFEKGLFMLVALNPFIISEAIWNGHNDLLMALGILLGVYLAFKEKFAMSLLVLTLASFVKYISLILIPLVLILAIKFSDHKYRLVLGLIYSLICFWFFNSYYGLMEIDYSLISKNITLSHKSLFDVLNSLFKYTAHTDLPKIFRLIFILGYFLFALWLYLKYLRKGSRAEIFSYAFWLIFVLLFLASPKFHSWYFLMLLPLGVLVHPRLMFLLSISHMLSFTFIDQANILNYLLMTAVPCGLAFKNQS